MAKKIQRPKREFNIVTSGQFRTLAMFYFAPSPKNNFAFPGLCKTELPTVIIRERRSYRSSGINRSNILHQHTTGILHCALKY